jgi:hypothetical protein
VADTTTGVKNRAACAGSGPAGSRAHDVAFRDRLPRWSDERGLFGEIPGESAKNCRAADRAVRCRGGDGGSGRDARGACAQPLRAGPGPRSYRAAAVVSSAARGTGKIRFGVRTRKNLVTSLSGLSPEVFEAASGEFGIPHRVLDVPVPETHLRVHSSLTRSPCR